MNRSQGPERPDKERIRAAIDYRTYYGERVRDLKPAGGGGQVLGTCPFHTTTNERPCR
jgi:hypothetical protein